MFPKLCFLSTLIIKSVDGKGLGQHYYENICWKSINQSIGRAIRHQNDYSTIILLDNRYCTATMSSMMEKLPQWIGDNFRQEDKESFDYKKIMDTLTKASYFNRYGFLRIYVLKFY